VNETLRVLQDHLLDEHQRALERRRPGARIPPPVLVDGNGLVEEGLPHIVRACGHSDPVVRTLGMRAWQECDRADWMIQACGRHNLRTLIAVAVDCVERLLPTLSGWRLEATTEALAVAREALQLPREVEAVAGAHRAAAQVLLALRWVDEPRMRKAVIDYAATAVRIAVEAGVQGAPERMRAHVPDPSAWASPDPERL
jgi:hypothetical protein